MEFWTTTRSTPKHIFCRQFLSYNYMLCQHIQLAHLIINTCFHCVFNDCYRCGSSSLVPRWHRDSGPPDVFQVEFPEGRRLGIQPGTAAEVCTQRGGVQRRINVGQSSGLVGRRPGRIIVFTYLVAISIWH